MQTRIESSEFTRSHASLMIASISPESALRASGRFMVTTSLWPTCSTRQWGAVSGALSLVIEAR
jgi:hypothetical protein